MRDMYARWFYCKSYGQVQGMCRQRSKLCQHTAWCWG